VKGELLKRMSNEAKVMLPNAKKQMERNINLVAQPTLIRLDFLDKISPY
jgi:hypothetical protein